MSLHFSFVVLGEPVAKASFRFARIKKGPLEFTKRYLPKHSRAYEETIRYCALETIGKEKMQVPMTGAEAVEIRADFYFVRPKSRAKKTLIGKVMPRIVKPDEDNLSKSLKDALKGIFYRDDSQVFHRDVWKWEVDSNPRVEVTVTVYSDLSFINPPLQLHPGVFEEKSYVGAFNFKNVEAEQRGEIQTKGAQT